MRTWLAVAAVPVFCIIGSVVLAPAVAEDPPPPVSPSVQPSVSPEVSVTPTNTSTPACTLYFPLMHCDWPLAGAFEATPATR
jgi:hypothetical protein